MSFLLTMCDLAKIGLIKTILNTDQLSFLVFQ